MIKGDNLTLLDVTYIYPRKIMTSEGPTKIEESFEVIYKDEHGNVHKSNEPADVDIYFVKPEYRDFNYNKPQERIERLEKRRIPYNNIRWEIANEMGESGRDFIAACGAEMRKPRELRDKSLSMNRLYGWRFAFGCDFQPEFYFMRDWYSKYELKNAKLTKSFLDIETDLIDYSTNMDQIAGNAHAPVNCVTLITEETKECFTFILRPYKPPESSYTDPEERNKRVALYESQLKQHVDLMNHMDEFIKDLHDSFDATYGDLKYQIREYEEEIELIADIFRVINNRKPNFCLCWNMRFDIQYLVERVKSLGYDPVSIMCHKDFQNPRCDFRVDRMTFDMAKQFDFFYCSSYTQFICQMRLYASIRKSQQMLKSVSLNSIGDRELKDRKVEYQSETNMMMFPYVDWKRFIKYNIKDVLIQMGIERKTNDVMTYYSKSHSNLTPYNKIFRETHLLRNVREMYFNKVGWVQGNNINIINGDEDDIFYSETNKSDEDDDSSFKGAIMADPTMNANVGISIMGMPSNIVFKNAMDYDMGAFYPSIKIACNMDPSTLIYKAEFNNEEFISGQYPNRSLNTIYQEKDKNGKIRNLDITGEAINGYLSGNTLTFGYNYLGIPDMTTIFREVYKSLGRE